MTIRRTGYCVSLLLLSGLSASPIRAQDTTRQFVRSSLLKTNLGEPLSLVLEVPTTNRRSLQGGVQYLNVNLFSRAQLFSLTPAYKFYVSRSAGSARRPAPKGLYLSPYLRYRWVKNDANRFWSDKSGTVASSTFGGGAVVGTQFINRWGFTLDGFLGGGYNFLRSYRVTAYDPPNPPPIPNANWLRYDIRIGLCVGIAFTRPNGH